MKLIGLTGGIASGKTTVREMFAALGAAVLDADGIYHELLTPHGGPSELAQAVAARFPGVLRPDGTLDRARLGERIFANPEERRALEAITHPAIASEVARRVQALERAGVRVVIYDVPLLYERGYEQAMQGVIVVWVPRAVQLERLMARGQLDAKAAEQRIAAQLALDEKRRRARWVIDNSGTREATLAQVQTLWRDLQS